VFVTNDLNVGCLSRIEGWPTHRVLADVYHQTAFSVQVSTLLQKEGS